MPASAKRTSSAGSHLPPVLLLAGVTAAFLWPAVRRFSTDPLMGRGDSSMFYWSYWQWPRSLSDGRWTLDGRLLFHPVGADLASLTSTPLIAIVSWPVRATVGPAAQINALQLTSTLCAGVAVYFLALRACRSRGPALVAGAAYALTPFRFVHLGHLNLIWTAVLPLSLLAFLRLLDAPSRGRSLALAAAMAGGFMIDPQLAYLAGVALLVLGWAHRDRLRDARVHLVAAGLAAALAAAPIWIPLLRAVHRGELGDSQPAEALVAFSSMPLSWVVPAPQHPWFGGYATSHPIAPTLEGVASPGLVVLMAALLGARLVTKAERRGWVSLAGVGIVLSLGPYLAWNAEYVPIPLPYWVLHKLPVLDAFRVPGRFALIGVLALIVLAAETLAALERRGRRGSGLLVPLALVLVLVELLPGTVETVDGEIPTPYRAIAEDARGRAGDGAVLEIPLQWNTGERYVGDRWTGREDSVVMVYATVHGRPMVNGSVSRYPDERLKELLRIPTLRQILALEREPGFDEPATFDIQDLRDLGIGYVVYHRERPVEEVLDYVDALGLPVLADDGSVLVWRVPAR